MTDENIFKPLREVARNIYKQAMKTRRGSMERSLRRAQDKIAKEFVNNKELHTLVFDFAATEMVGKLISDGQSISQAQTERLRTMARERGEHDGGAGGGGERLRQLAAIEAREWMEGYVLFDRSSLYEVQGTALQDQAGWHDKLVRGNTTKRTWLLELDKEYAKRCSKRDKPLGEVIDPVDILKSAQDAGIR